MSTLVVAATEVEARYVPAGTDLLICGVGKTAAASAVAAELARRETDGLVVVNLGSAGALRDGLSGVFEPSTVINHDISADAIRSLGLDPQDELELIGGDGTVLATGDVFVSEPAVRDRLAARASLVDMEGYAVAYACRAAGVPCRLVKDVSDQADDGAHGWASLVDASARRLAAWLERAGA